MTTIAPDTIEGIDWDAHVNCEGPFVDEACPHGAPAIYREQERCPHCGIYGPTPMCHACWREVLACLSIESECVDCGEEAILAAWGPTVVPL